MKTIWSPGNPEWSADHYKEQTNMDLLRKIVQKTVVFQVTFFINTFCGV